VSPLWIWYWGKQLHGWPNENKGVWIRYTLKALLDKGFVYEPLYPVSERLNPPSDLALMSRYTNEVLSGYFAYYSLSPSQIKDALAKGRCVVVALNLNKSFYGNTDGILVVGYDDDQQHFIMHNSWSSVWGDSGDCYVPYSYALSNVSEAWTLDYK
jgi:hypothetical protein